MSHSRLYYEIVNVHIYGSSTFADVYAAGSKSMQ